MSKEFDDDAGMAASAYLDGELEVEARREVESDASTMAEVERLRQVRAVLSDVEMAPISVREQHLAAALDAWDRVPERERTAGGAPAGSPITTPAVTSLDARRRSRKRWNRALTAAAAVVVVGGGLALAASGGLRGDDDSSASTAEDSDTSAKDVDGQDRLAVEAGNEFGSLASGSASADAAAPAPLDDPGSQSTDLTSELAATEAVIGGDEAPPSENDIDILRTRDDLIAFASFAVGAPSAEATPEGDDGEESDCGFDTIAGQAIYLGTLVTVGIDTDRNEAVAYLAANCEVVDRARLD